MRIIVYDFEVFKNDTLFGCLIKEKDKDEVLFQTWDLDEIRTFYYRHANDLWIGWNNWYYDDLILEAIVNKRNPYKMNLRIINSNGFRPKCTLDMYSYDLMATVSRKPIGLKTTELVSGKNIHTTEVDFDLDRNLTEEERKLTEQYNESDIRQTYYNYNIFYDKLKLRLDIINQFNLDFKENLRVTGTKLAANVLGAKHDDSLQYKLIKPELYPTLQLENERLKRFYLDEEFRIEGQKDVIKVGNAEITIAAGGAHSAIPCYHTDKFLYFDVSGYYNLIMINYDLLPRTLNEEGKKLYEFMYHEQLRLKKSDPIKRVVYKTILLSVFGAMNNEYCDFYDPQKALLVTITGQLFIVDLLEKLKDLVKIIQTNTDGIMIEPNDWNDEQKIISIVEEWEKRTGFVIKKEHKFDLWQRDVNCYIYKDDKGSITVKGEAVKNYEFNIDTYANGTIFECKEPPIVAKGIVEFLLNKRKPEDIVEENKKDLKLFQYICKRGSYDYTTYETINIAEGLIVKSERLHGIDRGFAYNNPNELGMIYKHKISKKGTATRSKIANLPDNVFVYNYEIENAYETIKDKIDYNYYVGRIYERILEFILPVEQRKKFTPAICKFLIDTYEINEIVEIANSVENKDLVKILEENLS